MSPRRPLADLLDALVEYVLVPDGAAAGIEVTSVDFDSRAVTPGSLFCAVKGEHADGHDHAAAAVANGAVALVVEHRVDLDVPQVVVPDSRAAMGFVSDALYDRPSRRIAVVGVTGTNGKTTVTHVLAAIPVSYTHLTLPTKRIV